MAKKKPVKRIKTSKKAATHISPEKKQRNKDIKRLIAGMEKARKQVHDLAHSTPVKKVEKKPKKA